MARFHVTAFSDLGLLASTSSGVWQQAGCAPSSSSFPPAASLLAAAAADSELLAALLGGSSGSNFGDDGGGGAAGAIAAGAAGGCGGAAFAAAEPPLLQDVLDMSAQALMAFASGEQHRPPPPLAAGLPQGPSASSNNSASGTPSSEAEAVSRCLCGHYGVERVELLGYGPAGHVAGMARACLQQQSRPEDGSTSAAGSSHYVASPALVTAHALVSGVESGAKTSSPVGGNCPSLLWCPFTTMSPFVICMHENIGMAAAAADVIPVLVQPLKSFSVNHRSRWLPPGRLFPCCCSRRLHLPCLCPGCARGRPCTVGPAPCVTVAASGL